MGVQSLDGLVPDGRVRRPTLREALGGLLTYLVVVTVLLAVVWLRFGTAWGYDLAVADTFGVVQLFLLTVVGGLLLASPWLSWRQRGAGVACLAGLFLFLLGVYGDGMVCAAVGYPAPTEWVFSYDVGENALRYGHSPVGSDRVQCGGSPNRVQASLGTVVATAGLLEVIAPSESMD